MRKSIQVIQTSKYDTGKWNNKGNFDLLQGKSDTDNTIDIYPEDEYQEWLGFGGAFTEAAAYSLSKVSKENQKEIIYHYFNKEHGLGYTLGRTHIHSCDFSLENYTYVEENDEKLQTFSIDREKKLVIPLIKAAIKEAGEELSILSSPWSPPAWMKTNGDMNHGGKLKEKYRDLWALYYVKYIQEMSKEGINIWGVSVQNEPEATQVWDSCRYTAEEERDFVKFHLGPTLEKHGFDNKKIVIWDHNRDLMVERAEKILSDPEAAKYIWGVGNHWYVSEEFENLSKVHEMFPNKHLIFTEGCIEGGVQLGAWHTGERYARNIIGDMNNWLEAFLDWNIVLDEKGGPNHVGNYCDSPVIVDTNEDVVHYNSSFYYIGHFSKYIKPGAKRIATNSKIETLSYTAFKNSDGSIALVVLNETEQDIPYTLQIEGKYINLISTKRSINTILI
ncbi:glycoside hydrolase family 30 protein [Evansella cellulosilytica]|uniref:Glucosylceramidase n=1 Tax=Evansella cellulosilytica (strain ATCC 21833 / DSM 2522 / FERM P-1141 / JCM 9156 / N-4) TaxID=649639 RepID=E6TZA9_EVAC2|nr:glycoside hydrolase family 30 protein [Evansella cellulosilytica]ADU28971.1 Glucosylceramidase [Evansella cellulosilytica DSM 2522]